MIHGCPSQKANVIENTVFRAHGAGSRQPEPKARGAGPQARGSGLGARGSGFDFISRSHCSSFLRSSRPRSRRHQFQGSVARSADRCPSPSPNAHSPPSVSRPRRVARPMSKGSLCPNRGLEMKGATPRFLHVHCNGTPAQAVEFLAWAGLASIPSCCPKGHKWKLLPDLHWRCNHRVGNDYPFNKCGCYRKTGAYIGQTQIYPQIGSNKATRLRPGSILHESVTRYPVCGVPRPLGAQILDIWVGQPV